MTQLFIRIGDSEEITKAESVAFDKYLGKNFAERWITGYRGKEGHFENIPKYLWN